MYIELNAQRLIYTYVHYFRLTHFADLAGPGPPQCMTRRTRRAQRYTHRTQDLPCTVAMSFSFHAVYAPYGYNLICIDQFSHQQQQVYTVRASERCLYEVEWLTYIFRDTNFKRDNVSDDAVLLFIFHTCRRPTLMTCTPRARVHVYNKMYLVGIVCYRNYTHTHTHILKRMSLELEYKTETFKAVVYTGFFSEGINVLHILQFTKL